MSFVLSNEHTPSYSIRVAFLSVFLQDGILEVLKVPSLESLLDFLSIMWCTWHMLTKLRKVTRTLESLKHLVTWESVYSTE